MQNHHAPSLVSVVFIVVVVVLATMSLATPVFAQRPAIRPENSMERTAALRRERDERQTRELELRNVENPGTTKPAVEDRYQRIIYEQIREDFHRLQLVNNEMMQATFPAKSAYTPDSNHISKSTDEMHKRAKRLLTNLRLPETEIKEQKPANQDIANANQLKSALLELDSLVMSFIGNPTFKHRNVVDVVESVRAKRDLLGIIELSRRIKQHSEKLKI
jgi:hypothetical protein